ncbi:MAG: UDP-2,3-diacylglucosamine diphosphatase LpxI [Candidatus Tectomicrobia bacterium]|nr:UDP-2,3-diacylglucosamine diphosphatase LpxI [Candidatus Tectomicrobia bacterium]
MPSSAPSSTATPSAAAAAPEALGLIAGDGEAPGLIAGEARRQGRRVVTVSLSKTAARLLDPLSDSLVTCGVGQAQKIIASLQHSQVRQLVLAGKVRKRLLFENPRFDRRALRLLRRARQHDDGALLRLIIDELQQEGFEVLSQLPFLGPYLAPAGCLGRRRPTPREWQDIEAGLAIARRLADLEVGQTVVVKNTTILSLEAVEGTDEAVRRGCALARRGGVVVKVSRSAQDYRFDVPAVGLQTVENLKEAGGRVLAVEAQRTLLLQRREMLGAADRAGISVVGVA